MLDEEEVEDGVEAGNVSVTANVPREMEQAMREIAYEARLTRSKVLRLLIEDLVGRYKEQGAAAFGSPARLKQEIERMRP